LYSFYGRKVHPQKKKLPAKNRPAKLANGSLGSQVHGPLAKGDKAASLARAYMPINCQRCQSSQLGTYLIAYSNFYRELIKAQLCDSSSIVLKL
jgi:hypothetical protein